VIGGGGQGNLGGIGGDPVINLRAAGPQDIGVAGNRLVQVDDPVAAHSIRKLDAAAGDVIEASGEIGKMRTIENHQAALVEIAVRNLEPLHRMPPVDAPSLAFGDMEAGNHSAVGAGRDKGLGMGWRKRKEERKKRSSKGYPHGRRRSGIATPISS